MVSMVCVCLSGGFSGGFVRASWNLVSVELSYRPAMLIKTAAWIEAPCARQSFRSVAMLEAEMLASLSF